MRRPETAGELLQVLQEVNWPRTSLPRMAEVVCPLCVFLEERTMGATRRTKQMAANREIAAGEWTSELIGAWDAAKDLIAHTVALSHRKPGCCKVVVVDAVVVLILTRISNPWSQGRI